jgi:hypothetical protein
MANAYFERWYYVGKILPGTSVAKLKKKHGKLTTEYTATQPKFKLGAFQTQVYSISTTPTWPVTLDMT